MEINVLISLILLFKNKDDNSHKSEVYQFRKDNAYMLKLTIRANHYGHADGLTLIKEILCFKKYLLGFLKSSSLIYNQWVTVKINFI